MRETKARLGKECFFCSFEIYIEIMQTRKQPMLELLHTWQCAVEDGQCSLLLLSFTGSFLTHLSPGVCLIYDLAYDSGMLQSELFTSRSQNLVFAKLPSSGFWRYSKFFKWNRVKMAKIGLKMVEIFWGASHMINNNIFNIFLFFNFFFWVLYKPCILAKFKENSSKNKV